MANMIQKINLFFFYFFLFEENPSFWSSSTQPNPSSSKLEQKKNLSSTYCHIAVLLNLQLQLDKFKNNEEKAIIVFCNFDI
jgi:hypothetical protein